MIDDIKLSCQIENYYQWKESVKDKIKRPYWKTFEDDGDVKTEEDDGSFATMSDGAIKWRQDKNENYRYSTIIHYTGFQTLKIEVKETLKVYLKSSKREVTYHLVIYGSLKKNHLFGSNYGKFRYADLQHQIKLISELNININTLKIDNLAPSVTFETPFPVFAFLKNNLISYRGERFKQYDPDSNGKIIGYHCPLNQLDIKVYDKALQFNIPYDLMQFETRFNKMQRLKAGGIEYLSDLGDWAKANSLIMILLSSWDDVLLYDSTISTTDIRLNERQREMIKFGDNCRYWEKLRDNTTRSTYNNRVKEFRGLSATYGSNHHKLIGDLIKREWDYLAKSWTNLPGVKNRNLDKLTGTIRGNNVQIVEGTPLREGKLINNIKFKAMKKNKGNKTLQEQKRSIYQDLYKSFQQLLDEKIKELDNPNGKLSKQLIKSRIAA